MTVVVEGDIHVFYVVIEKAVPSAYRYF